MGTTEAEQGRWFAGHASHVSAAGEFGYLPANLVQKDTLATYRQRSCFAEHRRRIGVDREQGEHYAYRAAGKDASYGSGD